MDATFAGILAPMDYYSVIFTNTGSFPYVCAQHPSTTGIVYVVLGTMLPAASVSNPAADTRFGQPATFSFQVLASDSDGNVTNLSFLANGGLLGASAVSPYNLLVNNFTAGL